MVNEVEAVAEHGQRVADAASVVARYLMVVANRTTLADLADENGQLPLFIGPCFHCGVGYVTHLPCPCPNCGMPLRRIVHPLWTMTPGLVRLYRRWLRIKLWVWSWTPTPVQAMWLLGKGIVELQERQLSRR